MSSLVVENMNGITLDEHVEYLNEIVHLYLADIRNREERAVVLRRLKRYCKLKDLSGLNNMLLNASSHEVRQKYKDFQQSDEMENLHLLDEFSLVINSSGSDFS